MTLANLKPGDSAIVSGFKDSDVSLKLMEMGCLPGEIVKVIGVAPLGDPISIKVSGYILSLRKKEAGFVRIAAIPSLTALNPSA